MTPLPDEYGVAWDTVRYIYFVIFLLLTIVSVMGIIDSRPKASSQEDQSAEFAITAQNLRRIVYVCMTIASITQAINAAYSPKFKDQLGTEWLLWAVNFPVGYLAYISILFHW